MAKNGEKVVNWLFVVLGVATTGKNMKKIMNMCFHKIHWLEKDLDLHRYSQKIHSHFIEINHFWLYIIVPFYLIVYHKELRLQSTALFKLTLYQLNLSSYITMVYHHTPSIRCKIRWTILSCDL